MLAGARVYAENPGGSETDNSVPELVAFHEVIYPLWHEAYPAKDTDALKGLVPRINELAAKIYKAQLPGILREKKAAWKTGVSGLRKSVKTYNAAAKGADAGTLLAAAEDLHRRYEMLVRTIRPVLPEMEAFHKVLYVVYHKNLPAAQWEAVRQKASELSAGARSVAEARLPKRFEGRAAEFKKAADGLVKATAELEAPGASVEGSGIKISILKIHGEYLALQKIFE